MKYFGRDTLLGFVKLIKTEMDKKIDKPQEANEGDFLVVDSNGGVKAMHIEMAEGSDF